MVISLWDFLEDILIKKIIPTYSLILISHVITMVFLIYHDIDRYDGLQDIVNAMKC